MKQLKQKLGNGIVVLLVLVSGFSFSSVALASEINPENVVKYVNKAREKEGIVVLRTNSKLTEVAKLKADDMVLNKYFAHTSPKGITPWYWFEKVGYDYKYAGENLAINFITAEEQQEAWMNSPTHRKNILNVDYEEIGVAVVAGEIDGQAGIITVQEFGALARPAQKANDPNNFSVQDKNSLKTKDIKFVPSVLSFKDVNLKNNTNKVVNLGNNFLTKDLPLNDIIWNVLLIVILISIMSPLLIVEFVSVFKFLKTSWLKLKVKKH